MSPSEFMLYVTPVVLLVSQEIRAYLSKRDLKRTTAEQTEILNAAGRQRAEALQTTTVETAAKLAVHTSQKTNAIGDELTEIHELVNGNTTALKLRIAELESQLASANHHT